jgi:hypothetical protein
MQLWWFSNGLVPEGPSQASRPSRATQPAQAGQPGLRESLAKQENMKNAPETLKHVFYNQEKPLNVR